MGRCLVRERLSSTNPFHVQAVLTPRRVGKLSQVIHQPLRIFFSLHSLHTSFGHDAKQCLRHNPKHSLSWSIIVPSIQFKRRMIMLLTVHQPSINSILQQPRRKRQVAAGAPRPLNINRQKLKHGARRRNANPRDVARLLPEQPATGLEQGDDVREGSVPLSSLEAVHQQPHVGDVEGAGELGRERLQHVLAVRVQRHGGRQRRRRREVLGRHVEAVEARGRPARRRRRKPRAGARGDVGDAGGRRQRRFDVRWQQMALRHAQEDVVLEVQPVFFGGGADARIVERVDFALYHLCAYS